LECQDFCFQVFIFERKSEKHHSEIGKEIKVGKNHVKDTYLIGCKNNLALMNFVIKNVRLRKITSLRKGQELQC
jgi:hypothetical protein